MTNWFDKLNITEKDLKDFFHDNDIFKNDSIKFTDIVSIQYIKNSNFIIVKGICPVKKGYVVKELFCSPFYIHDHKLDHIFEDTLGFKKYLNEQERNDWELKIKSQDFSSTPKAYYELFLSKCNESEKAEFLKELKELYTKTIKSEISLLEEKASQIKNEFDKEIIIRKRLLMQTLKFSATPGHKNAQHETDEEENE